MKFDKKTVATIEARAKQSCEVCGGVVGSFQIHHRRPRGMGGSKIEIVGSASNGVLVHPACHTRIESNRNEARSNGWLVYQTDNPSLIPFKTYDDNWVILNEDGSKTWTIKPD